MNRPLLAVSFAVLLIFALNVPSGSVQAIQPSNLAQCQLPSDHESMHPSIVKMPTGRAGFPTVRAAIGDSKAASALADSLVEAWPPRPGEDLLSVASKLERTAGLPQGSFEPPSDAPDLRKLIPEFQALPRPTLSELVGEIDSPEELQAVLQEMLESQLFAQLGDGGIDNWDVLREVMPVQFTGQEDIESPFSDFEFWRGYLADPTFGPETIQEWHAKYDEWPAPVYDTLLKTKMYLHPQNRLGWLMFADPNEWVCALPPEAWPQDEPLSISILQGRITLGTPHDDHYTGTHEVLLDPGGNDVYEDCRLGCGYGLHDQSLGYFVDLQGDDFYNCEQVDFTLGSAILGIGVFYDLGSGNDIYRAGSVSLGASLGGLALLLDDGGRDHYLGSIFTQGAAAFGVAIMVDGTACYWEPAAPSAENDTYEATSESQGFARTRGIALCINMTGNDTYSSIGAASEVPLLNLGCSQGSSIGDWGSDCAAGIAVLIDREGDDIYRSNDFSQGFSYFFGAGMLLDLDGDDIYECGECMGGQGGYVPNGIAVLFDASGVNVID